MWKLKMDRRTDNGWRVITIVHLSLRLRCTKKDFLFMFTRLLSLSSIVSLTFDCYNLHSIGSSSYHRQHICQVWSKYTGQFYLFFVQEGVSLLVNCDLDLKIVAIMLHKLHSPNQQFKTTAYTVQSINTKIINTVYRKNKHCFIYMLEL